MVMVYKYKSVGTTSFNVDLGSSAVRLGSIQGFSERAEHLAVGTSQVSIDNPDGTVGHSSDQILGLQLFTVDESDCPAGNRRLFTGYIGTREYGDGPRPTNSVALTGAGNVIDATLYDLNAVVGFRIIPVTDTAANRPAETVSSRMTWILGSTYLTGLVADNGLVAASAVMMTKNDYRGQRPTNVINDCEIAADYFAFVYPDETQTVIPSLFFDNANTSTAYTTTLRLTNVLADVDNVTTFAVDWDFKLRRVPDDVGSQVDIPWLNGSVHRTRAATAAIYGTRDLSAPNANIRSKTAAQTIADTFLYVHHTEEDRLVGTVRLPSQYVNNLRAGQRLQVKFRNRPGYAGWTWVRCLSRAPGQREETADFYTVAVELSPQEPACSTQPVLVQYKYDYSARITGPNWSQELTFPATSVNGNLLIVACITSQGFPMIGAVSTGWTWVVANLNIKADNSTFWANIFWKKSTADSSFVGQCADNTAVTVTMAMAEYSGLANPTAYAAAAMLRTGTGLGYSIVPATTYPAGAALVHETCFMQTGPENPDALTPLGTGFSLVYPVAPPAQVVNPAIGMGHQRRLTSDSGGTTPLYPAAGGWVFQFTNNASSLSIGLVFTGDNC